MTRIRLQEKQLCRGLNAKGMMVEQGTLRCVYCRNLLNNPNHFGLGLPQQRAALVLLPSNPLVCSTCARLANDEDYEQSEFAELVQSETPLRTANDRKAKLKPLPSELSLLQNVFSKNQFPTHSDIRYLQAHLSWSRTRIKTWFSNRRSHVRRRNPCQVPIQRKVTQQWQKKLLENAYGLA
mmetsp:Transcript_44756/g.87705  ORF Transcript_44756/g.87705 Transcript_44756/m.87705 type:complete len:181 (-) Transcript_44756:240-782(-)